MNSNSSPKWISQWKLIEYYLDYLFPNHPNDAPYAVYTAVVEGRIRCRLKGTIYTRQQANMLKGIDWGPDYSLPPDLAISVDDALEEFKDGISKIRAPDDEKSTLEITAILKKQKAADRTHASSKRKAFKVELIAEIIAELWPNGISLNAKDRNSKIREEATRRGCTTVANRTIVRALALASRAK